MALHHILPKFILRGFCINPNENKNNQEIMIYDRKSGILNKEKINTAYSKENFNSTKIETLLCKNYENDVARLFQRIKKELPIMKKMLCYLTKNINYCLDFLLLCGAEMIYT